MYHGRWGCKKACWQRATWLAVLAFYVRNKNCSPRWKIKTQLCLTLFQKLIWNKSSCDRDNEPNQGKHFKARWLFTPEGMKSRKIKTQLAEPSSRPTSEQFHAHWNTVIALDLFSHMHLIVAVVHRYEGLCHELRFYFPSRASGWTDTS